jgi:hypothetical protein
VAGGLSHQVIDQTYWLVHFGAGSLTANPLGSSPETMAAIPEHNPWPSAEAALRKAEDCLRTGTGDLPARALQAAHVLRSTSPDDWPDWLWARIEEVLPPDGPLSDELVHQVPEFLEELTLSYHTALVPETPTLTCPRCDSAMSPGTVEHRSGLFGRLSGGVGLTIRFQPASGTEGEVLIEPVDTVDAWVCSTCGGAFIARRGA